MNSIIELSLENKISFLHLKNQTREKHQNNCIYGLTNPQYKDYIKIGSTDNPGRRKYDYITTSPHEFKYLWIFYLEDFDYRLCDDLLKHELKNYNERFAEENVGIEFYKINNPDIISKILEKYRIKFRLEIGDKFNKKIESNKVNLLNQTMDPKLLEFLSNFTPEELKRIAENAGIKEETCDPEIDIFNLKFQYVSKNLESFDDDNFKQIKCQSRDFFIDRVKRNIKNICILGLIQSGKTNEIINLVYFCIRFLKIPVIIVIQNKTSGYKQLEYRFSEFIKSLEDFNFKVRYAKGTTLKQANSDKIFNPKNPQPEVIVALSNYKQLEKLEQQIEYVKINNGGKISPYAVFMDEYDEIIKSRSDISEMENISDKERKDFEKNVKRVEKHSNFIRDNSFINVGVTATLLAPMLTENKLKLGDIFSLTPQDNYVGFGSDRIHIIDINDHLTKIRNKIKLDFNKLEYLINEVDNSVDLEENKDYSLLLINISDDTDDHKEINSIFKNYFTEWSCVVLNSKGEDGEIECSLPYPIYSDIKYKLGTFTLDSEGKKTYTINKITSTLPHDHLLAVNTTREEREYSKYEIKFNNCSISDIITKLMTFNNKVAIVSGKMACRGLSFVDNSYRKHITDMIYVPSNTSSLTRNLQDMRIFGNFYNDGIKINLYTSDAIYKEDIKSYLDNQKKIIDEGDADKSCKENFRKFKFDPKNVPRKRLDRPGLTKGIKFNSDIKWGIPTNINDLDLVCKELSKQYRGYNILKYSFHKRELLPEGKKFIPKEQAENNFNMFKDLFANEMKEKVDSFFKDKLNIPKKDEYRIWHVYNNYRNAWPLHNPLNIQFFTKSKQGELIERKLADICYMGEMNGNYIDIILRNNRYDSKTLKQFKGTKTIIIFYAKGSYNYVKCDQKCYMVEDRFF